PARPRPQPRPGRHARREGRGGRGWRAVPAGQLRLVLDHDLRGHRGRRIHPGRRALRREPRVHHGPLRVRPGPVPRRAGSGVPAWSPTPQRRRRTRGEVMKLTAPPEGQIGAEVTDTDLRTLTAEEAATLRAAVYRHKLVVFRDQTLDKDEYLAFARKLGRPQVYFQKNYHHPQYPEIFVSSNVPDENGKKVGVAGTGQYWHSDY